jgi:hypothetical protein
VSQPTSLSETVMASGEAHPSTSTAPLSTCEGAPSTGEAQPPTSTTPPSTAFTRLKWTSFFHSCVYTSLLICAFALGKPQPETLVLGWTHGLLWIGMSLACITAARMRIVSLRLAVAVAVMGGIGPFFGSAEFVREQRRRATVRQREDTRASVALD